MLVAGCIASGQQRRVWASVCGKKSAKASKASETQESVGSLGEGELAGEKSLLEDKVVRELSEQNKDCVICSAKVKVKVKVKKGRQGQGAHSTQSSNENSPAVEPSW